MVENLELHEWWCNQIIWRYCH